MMAAEPPPSGPRMPYSELQQLAELHELGQLSDREFADQKQRILRGADAEQPNTIEVLAAIFKTEPPARLALEQLHRLHGAGRLRLLDAVIIVKLANGEVQVDDLAPADDAPASERLAGRVEGHIFPASAPLSAAAGTALGAAIGRWSGRGFQSEDLQSIGAALPIGNSAMLAVAYDRWATQLELSVTTQATPDEVVRRALGADIAVAVTLDVAPAVEPDDQLP